MIVTVIAFAGEPAHAWLCYPTNAIIKENKNIAYENIACKNHSSLILSTCLPSHQVLHRTQISNLKVYVLPAGHHVNRKYSPFLCPVCSHFIKQQNQMPNTFHNSAAFAHFPALLLGNAVSTLNSTHPDKEMGLCAFPWLHLWMRHSSTIQQTLQIRVGWEVGGDKWNEEQKW